MISEIKFLYLKVPTDTEVRALLENAENVQKFLTGEDYSYGLADVPDAEYVEHYARIVCVAPGFLSAGKWRPSFSWGKIVTTRLYVVIESAWTMTSANVNSMLRLCCDVEEPGNCRFS